MNEGMLSLDELKAEVSAGKIDTVVAAMVDLQGRFFGGRNVRVAFFSEGRFGKDDLAPQAGEFDN